MEIREIFNSALSYPGYRELVDSLLLEGKTTGNTQNEKLVEFTKLNVQRMNRLDKTIRVPEQASVRLKNLDNKFQWLLIGDAWCGDCAQIVPVINKIAEATKGKAELRLISRDKYPHLIEQYHTNGARAIPKLLVIEDQASTVLCSWGPRPIPAQEIMLNWKQNKDRITWEDFEKELHLWYSKDKGASIINEFITLVDQCERRTILQP